ncbi:unnamed protein product [Miscanthus lutarioriparius]|uniref:FHA domain-containing protein n=1 Tax=Miscanthus lutarioriparius TaxID=422564 RepID=A0A811RPD2_9POAL|nr:unnamed protein product [Miscanthus lutarioriparius]
MESDECCSSVAGKGHCVVYTADERRFEVPLAYLRNKVFKELLRMSQEEFGFTRDGRITLPCDASTMDNQNYSTAFSSISMEITPKSYRGYLQDLLVAASGTVLQRKRVSRNHQKLLDDSSHILIVYSIENQDKAKPRSRDDINTGHSQGDAQALACASCGKVVSSAWIVDSIAACNIQPL